MGTSLPPGPAVGTPAVPAAFVGRTSTLYLQDPASSLRRQYREAQDKLPAGMYIAVSYWDVESGGLDLEERGRSDSWKQVNAGIPRDGGLADLLAEAHSPVPRFAAVICENIERSGRDTCNALKLERELSDEGIPLFATDEPISVEGMNSTGVLIRRVKQGVAEWYRLQIKEAAWKGMREHALDGWNIGKPPYGYAAERHPHPAPARAAQGRTKTRLVPDPGRAEVVERIYFLRTVRHLGIATITNALSADAGACPPPDPAGWTTARVRKILANPKYTGYMVFGRRRKAGRRHRETDAAEWLWSPKPAHAAIINRETWDAAQAEAARHATSPDTTPGDHLLAAVRQFCDERLFGPDRAALLAAAYPDIAAAAQAARVREAAELAKRLHRNSPSGCTGSTPPGADPRAITALRDRTLARLTELQDERADITARLDALAAADPDAPGDPALLDELPALAGILDHAPARLRAQLYAALDLQALYNKEDHQVTLRAALTPSTPDTLRALLTDAAPGTSVSDLTPHTPW
jgi:DNA invertase Pin-like site-specific DNA recombinase